jgi:phenylacetate-CoA ligase
LAHPTVNAATGFLRQAGELNRLHFESRDEMEGRLIKRLRFLVKHAYRNFHYYRRSLDSVRLHPEDIVTLRDFRRLPVITKSNVADFVEQEAILQSRSGAVTSTGGTTGRPLRFVTDKQAGIAGLASRVFFDSWLGVKAHERKFSVWSHLRRMKDRLLLNEVRAVGVDLLRHPARIHGKLLSFRPKLVAGGAALRWFASYMIRNGLQAPDRLTGVVAWGIPLLPDQVAMLSEALCDTVYDRYGSAELGGPVAQQCRARIGLHFNTQLSFIEVLKDGEPCSEGERGRLVVTNLHNLATPFTRYDQEDTAVYLDDCACGSRLPQIAKISGKDPSSIEMKGEVHIP